MEVGEIVVPADALDQLVFQVGPVRQVGPPGVGLLQTQAAFSHPSKQTLKGRSAVRRLGVSWVRGLGEVDEL